MTTISDEISACRICQGILPNAPRPIFQLSPQAKIVIIGQAPGIKAHDSAQPWNDASGDKLRSWLGVTRAQFYSDLFAHIPMAFCFPGYKRGADAPPPKICAETWHDRALSYIAPQLIIHIGRYSQAYYLPQFKTLTEAVKATSTSQGQRIVLPHPSGRNNRWQAKNKWFEAEVIPLLRQRLRYLLSLN